VTHLVPFGSAGSRDTAAPGRAYAVAWRRGDEGTVSGALRADRDGLHLLGRSGAVRIPFAEIARLSIDRSRTGRLRGLPAISLVLAHGEAVRIASLEGAGALHEIVAIVERAGIRSG
jgi:hypothetical protein